MPRWLILVHRIPSRPLYLRAKMRQRLAAAGAIAAKNSVYLLPHSADALEDLQWIAQEIEAGGGDAHLFRGELVDDAATEAAVARFIEARDEDYTAIAEEAGTALKSARGAAAAADLPAAQIRLARRLEEVRRIDFFDAPKRAAAEKAIARIETRLSRVRKEELRMMKGHPELRGRTWVTRPGIKVDRMASIWYIRRFIDPRARFRFAGEKEPHADREIRFDTVGGEFTHEENRCTFETLVRKVGLPDKGVKAIAEIVHDIDLKEDRFKRPETMGVRALIEGIIARCERDEERIERALPLFDDLHESLGRARRKTK